MSRAMIALEHDPVVVSRRQKQIEYGKSTVEYRLYAAFLPKENRLPLQPLTPNVRSKVSRRYWDSSVKLWRKQLHCAATGIMAVTGITPSQLEDFKQSSNQLITEEASSSVEASPSSPDMASAMECDDGHMTTNPVLGGMDTEEAQVPWSVQKTDMTENNENEAPLDSSGVALGPEDVVMRRFKQIKYGKNDPDYLLYSSMIPASRRNPTVDPATPNVRQSCSRRGFDGQVKTWKKKVHRIADQLIAELNTDSMSTASDPGPATPNSAPMRTSFTGVLSPNVDSVAALPAPTFSQVAAKNV